MTSDAKSSAPAGTEPTRSSSRKRLAILFCLAWLPYALLVYHFAFLCDDAFISFRYASNWAEGLGLCYNPGTEPPVEGYSNFLWVAGCAVVHLADGDVTFWAPLASFVCGSLLLLAVMRASCNALGQGSVPVLLVGLFMGCSLPFSVWSTGGLETMPFALLLFLTFERLLLRRGGVAPWTGGFAALALALIRTEGVFWFLIIVTLAWMFRWLERRSQKRALITAAAIVMIGYAAYWGCRYAYYEQVFANTTYVKIAFSVATLRRGADYLIVQVFTFLAPLIVIPGSVAAITRGRAVLGIPIVAMAFAVPCYAVVIGGDYMAMGRLLVPGIAFNALLFGWLVHTVWSRTLARRALAIVGASAVIGVGLLPGWDRHVVPEQVRSRYHFRMNTDLFRSEYQQWEVMQSNVETWTTRGLVLRGYAAPGDSLVATAIGAVGYYSGLYIYDQAGLVSREVAHRDVDASVARSPGHDKLVATEFFLAQHPTFLFPRITDSPEELLGILWWQERRLRRDGLANVYVLNFERFVSVGGDAPDKYLAVSRRIGEGQSAEAAWGTFHRSRTQMLRTLEGKRGTGTRD